MPALLGPDDVILDRTNSIEPSVTAMDLISPHLVLRQLVDCSSSAYRERAKEKFGNPTKLPLVGFRESGLIPSL
jgi:hypothetical protein